MTIGPPYTEFASSSDRTKRRRTKELRATYRTAKLAFATEISLRSSGNPQAAKVAKDVTAKYPTPVSKYQSALKLTATPCPNEVPSDEALILVIGSNYQKCVPKHQELAEEGLRHFFIVIRKIIGS